MNMKFMILEVRIFELRYLVSLSRSDIKCKKELNKLLLEATSIDTH